MKEKSHIHRLRALLSWLLLLVLFSAGDPPCSEGPEGMKKLLAAYPGHLGAAGQNSISWKDGSSMIFDDAIKHKDFETLLDEPDLEDMLRQEYPAGKKRILQKNYDPGRFRVEAFFKKMYGASPGEVEKQLVTIRWLPGTVNSKLRVTRVNGVDKKLEAISRELERLPYLHKYIDNPAGAFAWRTIKGTRRLSPHCFGIALDINLSFSNYWRWDYPDVINRDLEYRNQIPQEIVTIFEKHGFIWGGKWYHYDTMHFEYRPELLVRTGDNHLQ